MVQFTYLNLSGSVAESCCGICDSFKAYITKRGLLSSQLIASFMFIMLTYIIVNHFVAVQGIVLTEYHIR